MDASGEIKNPSVVSMESFEQEGQGNSLFQTMLRPDGRSGLHGYAIRSIAAALRFFNDVFARVDYLGERGGRHGAGIGVAKLVGWIERRMRLTCLGVYKDPGTPLPSKATGSLKTRFVGDDCGGRRPQRRGAAPR